MWTRLYCGGVLFVSRGFPLTVDGGGDHHIQHLAAVARVKELVGPQGVEAQRTPARLVLRLHHHHHVETVAREVLPLQGERPNFALRLITDLVFL